MDRAKFFASIRKSLAGTLTKAQVVGMEAILDAWDARGGGRRQHLSYILATAWHETAGRMEPVIETRQASEAANPSVETAIKRLESSWSRGKLPWVHTPYWRRDADGLSWLGRGYPQVTHKDNYEKAEKATGHKFTTYPSLMLDVVPAIDAMFWGMTTGGFTGKKLKDYLNGDVANNPTAWLAAFTLARKIINAQESATKVAEYAVDFDHAILDAVS
jgi:hypothetical protein